MLLLTAGVVVALYIAINSNDVTTVFYACMVGIILLFVALGFAGYASGMIHNRRERYYVRREADHLTGLEPPGRIERGKRSRSAALRKSPVSGAHSLSEEGPDAQ